MATNDASNVTDVAVDAGVQAPSTSTSEVSNVMDANGAGQSAVGSDTVSSNVGNAEVAIVTEITKTVGDKTLLIAVVVAGVAVIVASMYLKRPTHTDGRSVYE